MNYDDYSLISVVLAILVQKTLFCRRLQTFLTKKLVENGIERLKRFVLLKWLLMALPFLLLSAVIESFYIFAPPPVSIALLFVYVLLNAMTLAIAIVWTGAVSDAWKNTSGEDE